jgi:hypothetical protein
LLPNSCFAPVFHRFLHDGSASTLPISHIEVASLVTDR